MSQNQKGEIKKSISVFLVLIMVFGSYLLPVGSVWAEDIEYDAFYENIDVDIDTDGGYEGAITLYSPSHDAALTPEEDGVFSEDDGDTADPTEGNEGAQTYFNLIPDAALTFVSAFYESIIGVEAVEDEAITFCAGASDDGTLTQSEVIRQLSEKGLSISDTFYAMFNESVIYIGTRAFFDSTGLIGVTISGNVKSIEESAFSGCRNLADVTISDSVESIGKSAFDSCRSLTNVTIPYSVESVGELAFSGCTGLIGVNISEGVTSIGDSAFRGCLRLTEVEIPDSVESIGASAFSGCTGLTNITISNNVISIGAATFNGCIKLVDIKIPDKVTSIGDSAFSDCRSLTSITIPASVRSIGDGAFGSCTSLTRIEVSEGNSSYSSDESGVLYNGNKTTLVVCPAGKDSCTIPDGVLHIEDHAFYDCIYITEIGIPDSVLDIGASAFIQCSSLISVTIGSSVKLIKDSAFGDCNSLTSIVIPDSVTNIGNGAFNNCISLTSVIIGNSVKEIGNSAFFATQIETVTLPLSVEAYGVFNSGVFNYGVFSGMSALKSIVFESSTTDAAIPANAFFGRSEPIDIFIPKNVKNISDDCGLSQNTTVYAFVGSYAEEYAIAKEIPFEPLPTIFLNTPVPSGYKYLPYSFKAVEFSGNAKLNVTYGDNWPKSLYIAIGEVENNIREQGEIYGISTEAGIFEMSIEAISTDGKVYPLKDEVTFGIEILEKLSQKRLDSDINGDKLPEDNRIGKYDEENDIYVIDVFYDDPDDVEFIFDCNFKDFIDLWIDGELKVRDYDEQVKDDKLLRKGEYYAEEGSTRIIVYGQTFKNLDEDIDHVIAAEFKVGGTAEGSHYTVAQNFRVNFVDRPVPPPPPPPLVTITQSSGGPGSLPGGAEIQEVETPRPGQPDAVWPFLDVKDTDWFAEDVKWVYENRIMLGVSDTAFAPYSPINPAMIVTALSRMLKANMDAYGMAADGIWYSEALAWGIDIGLFDGIDELSYDMLLERSQISIILAGLLLGAEVDATINEDSFIFYDVDLMSPEALGAFKLLNTRGIMNGKGNGMMDPLGVTTRAELAAILHRTNVYIEALLVKYGTHE